MYIRLWLIHLFLFYKPINTHFKNKKKDMKNAKNSAFFAQKAGGMADVFGGAEAAESTRDNGGSISEKGLAAAFKRAKTSGNFAVQNAGLKEVPADLCTFDAYKVPDENWWDSHELVKVDLSNNELASIPVTLAT